jgi:predicted outer membrane repeat protein
MLNNDTFERNYALGNGGAIYNQNSKGLINV